MTAEEQESDATKKGQDNSTEENRIGQEGERRKSYSAAVKDGIKRNTTIYGGDSIIRKTDSRLRKGDDVAVCLPGARIEHVTERVEKTMGRVNGGTILVHVGTNNTDKEGTTLPLPLPLPGVLFDQNMTMHKNITKTCASCYFHLRNISSIRDSLTDKATIQLVHAFVSSRIDYCNSLLYGILEHAIKKLQRVQNLAARVVTRSSKYISITPTLKKLHWLPVKYRIIFKVVLLTFKALHGLAPNYLRTLLQSYIPSRSLRSETGNVLIMPKARRKLGCQSFAVAAPKLWNDLPMNIRTTTSIVSFRSSLKTHLFKLALA